MYLGFSSALLDLLEKPRQKPKVFPEKLMKFQGYRDDERNKHTCMIEACFYRMNVSSRSVMHGKGKAKGQEPVFLKTHEPPVETCNSLALSKHRRLIESLPAGTQG